MSESQPPPNALFELALQEATGPALLLDASLRIVAATSGVPELLGGAVPFGKRAPQVLCGHSDKRPVAEALAQGKSASTEIQVAGAVGPSIVSVKTLPLYQDATLVGHLLVLANRGLIGEGGVTETHGILTASESMRALLRQVERVARSDASVLVRGETGAGKELVARAIHKMSSRADKAFAAINCAALPPQLLESELFGHVRGAFTGAVKDNEGYFRRADGGSLFLDEVAELPLAVQAKLLRVTQEKTVLPVGGSRPIPVNVRLISATHRALRNEVSQGRFRADLMYRLRVIPLFLPSLRERPLDIEPLAWRILSQLNSRSDSRQVTTISPGALRTLRAHAWPGNVRELQNVLEYAFLLGDGPVLSEAELPLEVRGDQSDLAEAPSPDLGSLPAEARRIARALERASGVRGRAADSLGMSRSTLWRKMREYGLDDEESWGSFR